MRILSMKCASCSAPLDIRPETTEFVCVYCGSAQIVDRSGGTATLNLVVNALGKVQQSTDRTASELALVRLKKTKKCIPYPSLFSMPYPPNKPNEERHLKRELNLLLFFLSNDIWRADRDVSKAYEQINKYWWKVYDEEMAAYNKSMLNWPSHSEENNRLLADYEKQHAAIDAEISIHAAIVKRSYSGN